MKVTMSDIARLAGVSKATVSRVINEKSEGVGPETRKKILDLCREMDYNPNLMAKGLLNPKSKTMGFILPDITNPFFSELIKSVENCASKNGYAVFFANTNFSPEEEEKYIATFISKRVDGLILTATGGEQGHAHQMLKKYNIPCVLLDRTISKMEYGGGVFVDNSYATFIACELLVRHGNRNIAYISGPANLSTSEERIEGYHAALIQYGLQPDERLIKYGNYTLDSGYKAVMELHRDGVLFTGVVAANDTMAFGAMQALKELKYRIPDDVEVVGFDNVEFSRISDPPLTTIMQPICQIGEEATKLLIMLIDGKLSEQKRLRLQPKLIIRSSTKKE